MNKLRWKLALVIAAAVVFFAPNAFADGTTTMVLTGAGTNIYDGAVFVGPYYATVGGNANTPVICDDYTDDSYVPESWTAYATNETLAGTTSNPLKWGSQQDLYNEMSWLATQLLVNAKNAPVADAIQFAIWDLGVESVGGSIGLPLPGGASCSGLLSANENETMCWLQTAQNNYASAANPNVTIYSFDTCSTTPSNNQCGGATYGPPQEFLVVNTPEPSTLLLFVLGLGGLFLFERRSRNRSTLIAA